MGEAVRHRLLQRPGARLGRRQSRPICRALRALQGPGRRQPSGQQSVLDGSATRRSTLKQLKADPGAISLESVLAEIAKLERLHALGLPADLFSDVSLTVVERFRQRAAAEAPNESRAHAPALRAMLVATLCWLRQREVTDSLVDLLAMAAGRTRCSGSWRSRTGLPSCRRCACVSGWGGGPRPRRAPRREAMMTPIMMERTQAWTAAR